MDKLELHETTVWFGPGHYRKNFLAIHILKKCRALWVFIHRLKFAYVTL